MTDMEISIIDTAIHFMPPCRHGSPPPRERRCDIADIRLLEVFLLLVLCVTEHDVTDVCKRRRMRYIDRHVQSPGDIAR